MLYRDNIQHIMYQNVMYTMPWWKW